MIARTAKLTFASLYATAMIGLLSGIGVVAAGAPPIKTAHDPSVGFALVILLNR